MTTGVAHKNCVDVVRPLASELDKAGLLSKVQFIGGVGSAALVNEATLILPDEEIIVAPEDLYLPTVRGDGNKRDIDLLVQSDDAAIIEEAEGITESVIGNQLEISVFGYRSGEHVRKQLKHPLFGWKALKTFVSDRYLYEDGRIDKVLFPFEEEADPESLRTSQLKIGDLWLPVANPAITLANYSNRSISGLRAKDAEKVQTMAANIFKQAPDYADWLRTGPGQTQLELGRIAHSLQGPADISRAPRLSLGGVIDLEPIPIRELLKHEAFMLRDRDPEIQENVLAWARVKSMALRKAESYDEVVRLYQKWAERLFDGISKNK